MSQGRVNADFQKGSEEKYVYNIDAVIAPKEARETVTMPVAMDDNA